ncbi:MAG TPA: hypothetical protein VGH47_15910 [Xanthobacteraceae bacterium]
MSCFQGRCRGGPWDGKDLEADREIYKVALMPPLQVKYPPDYTPSDRIELTWGTYHHVLGQWVWRQDAMSDQEYAEQEERQERIRNQREYEGDYD